MAAPTGRRWLRSPLGARAGLPRPLGLGLVLGLFLSRATAETTPPKELPSLADPERKLHFHTELCKVLRETQATPNKRKDRLRALLDEELEQIGLPVVHSPHRIELDRGDIHPLDGKFKPAEWRITVDERWFREGSLGAAITRRLERALYHELYHAEQYWLVICWHIDREHTGNLMLIQAPQAVFTAAYARARQQTRTPVTGQRADEARRFWSAWTSPEHLQNKATFLHAADQAKQARQRRKMLDKALAKLAERPAPRSAAEAQARAAERQKLAAERAAAAQDEARWLKVSHDAEPAYLRTPLEAVMDKVLAGLEGCGAA